MMTFLVAAGRVHADDDKVMAIQGLSLDQAEAVAEWLAVATGGEVIIRHMDVGHAHDIVRVPDDVSWKQIDPSGLGASSA